ncbi:MAG: hypothetical protein AAF531_17420 [Actinomycetota bacterium]
MSIGLLHTYVHVRDLAGDDLAERFRLFGTIDVSDQPVASWDLFQGTSILMGLFSLTVGLIDLAALRGTSGDRLPPLQIAAANIGMLAAIVTIGAVHLGALQVYGGLFGIVCFGIGPVAALRHRNLGPQATGFVA